MSIGDVAGIGIAARSSVSPWLPLPVHPSHPVHPVPVPPSRDPRIESLLAEAERRWGRGSLVRLGDVAGQAEVEVIPTGFPALDDALGIGGLPCGRISELFGPDSSGKQAMAAHLVVQCQRQEGVAAYVDVGCRLDPDQMRVIGVDFDAMLVVRPDNVWQAMEIAVRLARGGGIRLIVFDAADSYQRSVDSYQPSAIGGQRPALSTQHSALSTLLLRRLVSAVDRNGVAFVFITGAQSSALSPQHSALSTHYSRGGQALRFFASIRLGMERLEWVRRGREVVGCRSEVQVAKNKLSPPHREARVELLFYRFPPSMPALQVCSAAPEAAIAIPAVRGTEPRRHQEHQDALRVMER